MHRVSALPQPDAAEQTLVLQLIDVFIVNYGCLFPAISRRRLHGLLRQANGASSFLLDAVAAIAAK